MTFTQPQPFEEAVRKLGDRSPIGAALSSAQWSGVRVALRERAFWSAQVENVRFLQRGRNLINDFLTAAREDTESGPALRVGSRASFIALAREFAMAEGMGPLVPEDEGTLKDITSERRLGLIFDVQTRAANDYGDWKQGQDPDVLDEFPAQRFIREKEVERPRAYHEAHAGEVRLKSDLEFWLSMNAPEEGGFGVPWGPWGFNSGMGVEDVDRAEAEDLGLLKPGERMRPAEKDFNDHLKASVSGLDDAMVARLKGAFGDRVEFRDGMAVWKSDRPTPPAPASDPAPAPPEPDETSAPAPEPSKPKAETKPVSVALKLEGPSRLVAQTRRAIAAIDSVHGDGVLPQVPVKGGSAKGSLGMMTYTRSGEVIDIRVKSDGKWPALTTAHEIGHLLDLKAIGPENRFGSHQKDGPLAPVLSAIRESAAFGELKRAAATALDPWMRAKIEEYLMSDHELWARAYAQYVATRSTDPEMKRQLALAQESMAGRQWAADDFAPIAAAIDKAFKGLGWI